MGLRGRLVGPEGSRIGAQKWSVGLIGSVGRIVCPGVGVLAGAKYSPLEQWRKEEHSPSTRIRIWAFPEPGLCSECVQTFVRSG